MIDVIVQYIVEQVTQYGLAASLLAVAAIDLRRQFLACQAAHDKLLREFLDHLQSE